MTDVPGPDDLPREAADEAAPPVEPTGVVELIALIDRLEPMLRASGLDEIEIAAGATTLVLRAPLATRAGAPAPVPSTPAPVPPPATSARVTTRPATTDSGLRHVKAPLTGVFYLSPSPGAAAYVKEGGEVIAGQVIGLLEAMKLFNEIKSDVTGIVRRIAAQSGALVKTHEVLIEVEPT